MSGVIIPATSYYVYTILYIFSILSFLVGLWGFTYYIVRYDLNKIAQYLAIITISGVAMGLTFPFQKWTFYYYDTATNIITNTTFVAPITSLSGVVERFIMIIGLIAFSVLYLVIWGYKMLAKTVQK